MSGRPAVVAPAGRVRPVSLPRFADATLRGFGQVMLQDNPLTGFLFLVGVCVGDWVAGLYAVLGTAASTATASLFDAPRDEVGRGLYGFNGTLTGIALAVYLRHDPLLPAYVVAASAFAAVATAGVGNAFGARVPALTAPFVLATWVFVAARVGRVPPGGDSAPAATFGPVGALVGILNDVAEVMLQQSVWTGAIFLVGLAVASRTACAAAALGGALGLGVAWVLGASPAAMRGGLYGFNAALTAIALGGTFYRLDRAGVALAALGVCVSTLVYAAMDATLGRAGVPVLTAPFIATTWLCLLAGPSLTRLHAPAPASAAPGAPPGAARRPEPNREGGP